MQRLAQTFERIAGTTKKLEKIALTAELLRASSGDEAAIAAVFLSGMPFPVYEETTLQVGGSLLWRIVAELSENTEPELIAAYRKLGDLGAVAGAVLKEKPGQDVSLAEVEQTFRRIATAKGPSSKGAIVRELLSGVTPLEAKYIVKIMTGDLRVGLKESLVEEAIAKAYGATLREVQRANLLLGDIGETLRLAAAGNLSEARMRLFHPLGFMLASPVESAEEALSYFPSAWIEDKYDGIRAQAHCAGGEVRIFSRTRDDITESFPELAEALGDVAEGAIFDGEIVAWDYSTGSGRAFPFSTLQQRLGRKKVSDETIRRAPVAYLVFDLLYANGELLINLPLRERVKTLDGLLQARVRSDAASGTRRGVRKGQAPLVFGDEEKRDTHIIRAPVFAALSTAELDGLFDAAQARGNEGLMIKNPESSYAPGRRGKFWLKLKRELATLDVVVTTVEYGHGKRIGVLSDYTFAVRDGERLVNIGKAYSGLTDPEIAEMTKWFVEHTIEDQGFRRIVEPRIVLEVAFNNMMRSERHESGYALRFPRIVRLRPDKLPEEADTIERAREIYEQQSR
jgi:DNA ligase-1